MKLSTMTKSYGEHLKVQQQGKPATEITPSSAFWYNKSTDSGAIN
jgi:hypothetical protein